MSQASISADILASYAADAAREVEGVRGFPGRRAVKVSDEGGGVRVELHLAVEWGSSIATVGERVQHEVRDYLSRMADMEPVTVDVVVDEVGPRG